MRTIRLLTGGWRRLSLLLIALSWMGPLHATGLDEIAALADAGAQSLAIQLIDRGQPDRNLDLDGWARWERQRIEILRRDQNWQPIAGRLTALPAELPASFRRWALGERAAALVALGDGAAALPVLRDLLWKYGENAEAIELGAWRRMVIEAYLTADDPDDAVTAMLRYQQDYGSVDSEWARLRARVLLRVGRAAEAETLLAEDRSPEARVIFLLAQLRAGREPQAVGRSARDLASGKGVPRNVVRQARLVAAEAARRIPDHAAEIDDLADALTAPLPQSDPLFKVTGDDLWRAYAAYGKLLGNRRQFLLGKDADWYTAASNAVDKQPLEARALFAVVALESAVARSRTLAHQQFAALLLKERHGIAMLRALYLEPNAYARAEDLPEEVRHQLVDDALSRADIKAASRLMGNLTSPPKGVDVYQWQLRRARILIMGGAYEPGVQALRELIDIETLSPKRRDRLMQVIFDLQSVGRHRDAIALLTALPTGERDLQLRREVLYWIADSHKALGEYLDAGALYLRSATLQDAKAMDPWAQTARYQAADALAQAGLTTDARKLYQGLLDVTQDPSRRAVLEGRLQQLWLSQPATTPEATP